MAAQYFLLMTTCFSALSLSLSLSCILINYPLPCISAEAVCGVNRLQQPCHQVADGERLGLDHLVCRWGKLQGGSKQDFIVSLLFTSLLCC